MTTPPTCRKCGAIPNHSVGLPVFVTWGADGVATVGIDVSEIGDEFVLSCDCPPDLDSALMGPTLTSEEIDWFVDSLDTIATERAQLTFPNVSDKVGT